MATMKYFEHSGGAIWITSHNLSSHLGILRFVVPHFNIDFITEFFHGVSLRFRGLHSSNQQLYPTPSTAANTLGRFSKSTNRLTSTTAASTLLSPHHRTHHDYRSTQTLPRKLDNHKKSSVHSASVNNLAATHSQLRRDSTPNINVQQQPIIHNTGPAKPARTYKALNRSKSFNVHGLNGTNDPSPIYIEKLTTRHIPSNPSMMYKSSPHLSDEKSQLKSPSIVNLISRSQRDLTKIDEDSDQQQQTSRVFHYNQLNRSNHGPTNGGLEKRSTFLRGLQDQAPELYRTIHGGGGAGEDDARRMSATTTTMFIPGRLDRESSLGSRSPVTHHLNKDTASIVRRGSTSTADDYSETYKITSKSDDPRRPSITNTVHSFTKKTVPARNGTRGKETIESNERKSVTTSRYKLSEPNHQSTLRYQPRNSGQVVDGVGLAPGPVVIELRNRM